ncbi:hypothetical protein AGMMS50267_13090 [Spirochaetia bacterium]|nr:hypothetical protein AGMMS50267_13090 [Spirochaetia bacterium]
MKIVYEKGNDPTTAIVPFYKNQSGGYSFEIISCDGGLVDRIRHSLEINLNDQRFKTFFTDAIGKVKKPFGVFGNVDEFETMPPRQNINILIWVDGT